MIICKTLGCESRLLISRSHHPLLFRLLLLTCTYAVTLLVASFGQLGSTLASPPDAEGTIRLLIQANADRDMATLSRYIAHDADTVGYTIGGRKYVGWNLLAKEMEEEFASVAKLEIPISELHVWQHQDVAWFTMELEYKRYLHHTPNPIVLPLRDSGVLERRNGQWMLVSWHESFRATTLHTAAAEGTATHPAGPVMAADGEMASVRPDLSGQWDIQEEDKSYVATLNRSGNGTYNWKGGRLTTTSFDQRQWQGTWSQTENDREGGFEVLLSEDGQAADGIWWYTRVGNRGNIPPREHGGTYQWKRLTPLPTGTP